MNKKEENIVPIELLTKFFAEEANTAEKTLVEKWKNSSLENEKELDLLEKLWKTSGNVSQEDAIDVNSEWRKIKQVISLDKSKIISLKQIIQIAAAVLIISGLSILGVNQSQVITHKTTVAALRNIELPDGSIISLNANSKISYSRKFGKTDRNITLNGEGYFEVKRDTNLPFIIKAHETSIEVLGTKFNVKAYKNQPDIRVTVTEGRVKLAERKQTLKKTFLSSGETGTYDRKLEAVKKKPVANLNDISWKTRIMKFKNTPLNEVTEILSNTYQLNISLTEDVKNCAITVEFKNQDLASVLKVLKSTLDLKIQKDGSKLFISGNGC